MQYQRWSIVWLSILLSVTAAVVMLLSARVSYGLALDGTPAQIIDPPGCWEPPHDYERVWVNGALLNVRTLAMLDHAQVLYREAGGVIDLRLAITQGSYNAGGVAASFGTHDAGGAVDISLRSRVNWDVLYDEIDPLIRALRVAGFAAWVREENELYPGSVIHIHAIAVGDREHSDAARAQINGRFGYLRGYNGLPQIDGVPVPDRYGPPVLCQWMVDQGFGDMRGLPNPYPTPGGTTVPLQPIP